MREADGARPPVDRRQGMDASQTPYQLTLAALTFPVLGHCLFHAAAAASLALMGAPRLGLAWALACCLFDAVAQRQIAIWRAGAATADGEAGLRWLAAMTAARSALLFSAPVIFALGSHSPAALIYTGLGAVALAAAGVSSGWISKSVYAAMVAPAPLALGLEASLLLDGLARAGVLVGLLSLAAILSLIALGTGQAVREWSRRAAQTQALIQELRDALERSEAAERRLRVAVEIADLHVYEMDYERETLISQGEERTFFEEPMTFGGMLQDPFASVHPEDREQAVEAWARYEAGHAPFRAEYRVRRSDGRVVWAYAMAEMIRDDDGMPLRLVGAQQDITDRKRNELALIQARDAAEASSRAKSDFLASMSHEIRTPLNGVLGMAQAMERDALAKRQRDRLRVIRTSGETLLALLNGLLDLAKIEAGKLELEDGAVDASAILADAEAVFAPSAADRGLTLTVNTSPEAAGVFRGDAIRVRQIVFNLMSNAVKFTEIGGVQAALNYANGELVISVADTGIGFDPSRSAALFEKFVQADASTTRRYGGTGLGLAITQELVESMGGSIELESAPGLGSSFTVRLPLAHFDAPGTGGKEAEPIVPLLSAPGAIRVLAAEDNATNRLVLRTLLDQVGIEAVMVADGQEAFSAWERAGWDLIIMDVQMPVMDGPAASRAIRQGEMASGRRRTPIIALTANVMSHQVAEYREAGMDEVVAKPIVAATLFTTIEACLTESPGIAEPARAAGAQG